MRNKKLQLLLMVIGILMLAPGVPGVIGTSFVVNGVPVVSWWNSIFSVFGPTGDFTIPAGVTAYPSFACPTTYTYLGTVYPVSSCQMSIDAGSQLISGSQTANPGSTLSATVKCNGQSGYCTGSFTVYTGAALVSGTTAPISTSPSATSGTSSGTVSSGALTSVTVPSFKGVEIKDSSGALVNSLDNSKSYSIRLVGFTAPPGNYIISFGIIGPDGKEFISGGFSNPAYGYGYGYDAGRNAVLPWYDSVSDASISTSWHSIASGSFVSIGSWTVNVLIYNANNVIQPIGGTSFSSASPLNTQTFSSALTSSGTSAGQISVTGTPFVQCSASAPNTYCITPSTMAIWSCVGGAWQPSGQGCSSGFTCASLANIPGAGACVNNQLLPQGGGTQGVNGCSVADISCNVKAGINGAVAGLVNAVAPYILYLAIGVGALIFIALLL